MAGLISYLQNFSFRIANFIFGKSAVFVVIVGWYLAVTGVLFLVKPEKVRAKLVRSGAGIIKVNLLLVCFFIWGLLFRLAQHTHGLFQTIVFFGGLTGLIVFFLKGKKYAGRKLADAVEHLPLKVLTFIAWGQVLTGALMVYFQRRLR